MTRPMRHNSVLVMLSALLSALLGATAWAAAPGLAPLHVEGRWLVGEAGEQVVLRGCNLGGWLLIEPWMLGIHDQRVRDHHDFVTTLQGRFGAERAEALLDAFRANWITPRELERAKLLGFNVVRVPFHHGLLADDATPFALRADAFEWLDQAIALAQHAGMYTILDLHGAPGGQSVEMPSGRIGQNELWTDEQCQRRTVWLWQQIAERYRKNPAVVAYDLLNEPWGDLQSDERPALLKLVERLVRGVREIDADKLIFAPGARHGILFYGDPGERGWKNVGFTEHHYPGLFGGGAPTLETHARYLGGVVPGRERLLEELNVPYLLGEFNVVYDSAAQPLMMRKYFDTCASRGWLATMWSLRLINPRGGVAPDNWYLVTNSEPFRLPDLHAASAQAIEQAFLRLGEMPLVVDEPLCAALQSRQSPNIPLASYPPFQTRAASGSLPDGWNAADVGVVRAGSVHCDRDALVIAGAGNDIWQDQDAFEYAYRAADGDFEQRWQLTSFAAPHKHAKAGCMLRSGLRPNAAHTFVHAFPDGRIMMAWRAKAGGSTQERLLGISGLPVGLGIRRTGAETSVLFTDADGRWLAVAAPRIGELAGRGVCGMAVGSHDALTPALARFETAVAGSVLAITPGGTSENLLRNASFELGANADPDSDLARDWQRWGPWLNRETDWAPPRDGSCLLGYHHWQVETHEPSGIYQDLSGLHAGARCLFTVLANRDEPAPGRHGARTIELRIESTIAGQTVNVASQDFAVSDIAGGQCWSRLQVAGTLPSNRARVLIVVSPSEESPRDAAVKFDQAAFNVSSGTG